MGRIYVLRKTNVCQQMEIHIWLKDKNQIREVITQHKINSISCQIVVIRQHVSMKDTHVENKMIASINMTLNFTPLTLICLVFFII